MGIAELASSRVMRTTAIAGVPSSRALLARMSPPGKITEFFGFFSFSGKITAFAAPLLIGAVTQATGSQRLGIASSLAFLLAGLLLLLRVNAK